MTTGQSDLQKQDPLESNLVSDLHNHKLDQARQEINDHWKANPNSPSLKPVEQYVKEHGFPDFSISDRGDIQFVGTEGPAGANSHPFTKAEISSGGSSGIQQGNHGDCWFEASLAAVARTPDGQQQLADMIVQNPDRSYTVTFPGDKNNPVTVTADDIKKFGAKDSADWAKVVETAMDKKDPGEVDGGGDPKKALSLLTGKNVNQDNLFQGLWNSSPDRVASTLQQALSTGNPVVASARAGWDTYSGPAVKNHEYTVESYDPATQTVKLRNPWGTGNRATGDTAGGITELGNGEVSMSLNTFMNQFQDVTYVGAPKSGPQQVGQVVSDIGHAVVDIKQTSAAVVDAAKNLFED